MMKLKIAAVLTLIVIALAAFGIWTPVDVFGQESVAGSETENVTENVAQASLPVADDVTVQLTPALDEMAVGDPLELTVEVTHPAGTQALLPELGQSWGQFDVRSQSPVEVIDNGDGTLTTRQTVEVTLFAPGDYKTPPLAVTISDGSGALSQATAAQAAIHVASVLAGLADDLPADAEIELRDIKPQASMPIPQEWLPIISGALALILVLAGGAWLFRRHRQRVLVDNRPADQIALEQLARVDELDYPGEGRFKAHYSLVTDCLRDYLERQYRIPARDRTAKEMKAALQQTRMSSQYVQAFTALFDDSDLVKFAKFTPTADAAYDLVDEARQLVTETAAEVKTQAEADRLAEKMPATNQIVAPNGA